MDQGRTWKVPLWPQTLRKKLEKNLRSHLNQNQHSNQIPCSEVLYQGEKSLKRWWGQRKLRQLFSLKAISRNTVDTNGGVENWKGEIFVFVLFWKNRQELCFIWKIRKIVQFLGFIDRLSQSSELQVLWNFTNTERFRAWFEKDKLINRIFIEPKEFQSTINKDLVQLFWGISFSKLRTSYLII